MMCVRLKRQGQPDVGINELHLPRPELDQLSRWSNLHFLVLTMGPKGSQLAFGSRHFERPVVIQQEQSRLPLPVRMGFPRRQQHRFEYVRRASCQYYLAIYTTRQRLVFSEGCPR
jgi:hypothetical protein